MERIPLFPLDVVVFPGETFGLHVFEERYVLMTEEVLAEGLPIGIVLAKQDQPEDRLEYEPERIGTAVEVVGVEQVEDRYLLQTVGRRRFLIHAVHSTKPYQEADVEWLDEEEGDPEQARLLVESLVRRMAQLGAEVDESAAAEDPVTVSHAVAAALPLDLETKQRLLELHDATQRLAIEVALLATASA